MVVQLVRIPACHAGGRGFESRPYRRGERRSGNVSLRITLPDLFLHLLNNPQIGVVIICPDIGLLGIDIYAHNFAASIYEKSEASTCCGSLALSVLNVC